MALVKLRIDLERTLRQLAQQHGVSDGPPAFGPMLQRLATGPAACRQAPRTLARRCAF